MKVNELVKLLEAYAPPVYAEDYDNVGLLAGNPQQDITGIVCTLDCTEAVIDEAMAHGCNVVVAHHPILFRGIKKITGASYVERTLIKAIKHDIAIYAIHTNLDNVYHGVNGHIAGLLGLKNTRILAPKKSTLYKLSVFVPHANVPEVQAALFEAGCGHIGQYNECSFATTGNGTFKALEGTSPYVGEHGKRHTEPETKLEVVVPKGILPRAVEAMKKAHPYEEVAYDVFAMENVDPRIGSGMVGELETPLTETDMLALVKKTFKAGMVRYTPLTGQPVSRVALCGGSGSFLIKDAIRAEAQVFITSDIKYHEFFDAEGKILLADIGHFENEQFTSELLATYLEQHIKKSSTFAVRLSGVETNPVKYF